MFNLHRKIEMNKHEVCIIGFISALQFFIDNELNSQNREQVIFFNSSLLII
jgi:hypothetical protein